MSCYILLLCFNVPVVLHGYNLLVFGGTGIPFGESNGNDVHVCNVKYKRWEKLNCEGKKPNRIYGQVCIECIFFYLKELVMKQNAYNPAHIWAATTWVVYHIPVLGNKATPILWQIVHITCNVGQLTFPCAFPRMGIQSDLQMQPFAVNLHPKHQAHTYAFYGHQNAWYCSTMWFGVA